MHSNIQNALANADAFYEVGESAPQVVYLFGILPRSGTNMLAELLNAHPDIHSPEIPGVPEPFLLANADRLRRFVRAVGSSWSDLYAEPEAGLDDLLARSAWAGIERYFLGRDLSGSDVNAKLRLVRTPSVRNLDLFSTLTFSKAIVIVRDGRSVIESGMRSFGWSFERSVHRWADAASGVNAIVGRTDQILLVRYEDLIDDQGEVLTRIFEFLGIDAAAFPREFVPKVRGSSVLFDQGVYWEGVDAPEGFDPLERWRHWSTQRMARFDHVAGGQMEALGYGRDGRPRRAFVVNNLVLDALWPIQSFGWAIAHRVVPRRIRSRLLWWRGSGYRRRVSVR